MIKIDHLRTEHAKPKSVVRTSQCPYVENASRGFLLFADEMNIPTRSVKLPTVSEVQDTTHGAYGVFGLVYNGRLFSYTYLTQADYIETHSDWRLLCKKLISRKT